MAKGLLAICKEKMEIVGTNDVFLLRKPYLFVPQGDKLYIVSANSTPYEVSQKILKRHFKINYNLK